MSAHPQHVESLAEVVEQVRSRFANAGHEWNGVGEEWAVEVALRACVLSGSNPDDRVRWEQHIGRAARFVSSDLGRERQREAEHAEKCQRFFARHPSAEGGPEAAAESAEARELCDEAFARLPSRLLAFGLWFRQTAEGWLDESQEAGAARF